jgi:hypothetical protein
MFKHTIIKLILFYFYLEQMLDYFVRIFVMLTFAYMLIYYYVTKQCFITIYFIISDDAVERTMDSDR